MGNQTRNNSEYGMGAETRAPQLPVKTNVTQLFPHNADDEMTNPIDPRPLAEIFGNDIAAQTNILQKFALQAEQVILEYEAALEERDAETISFQTHKLKSSARTVGANELADVCFAMELAGKKADWDEIHQLSPQMRPAMERVRDYTDSL